MSSDRFLPELNIDPANVPLDKIPAALSALAALQTTLATRLMTSAPAREAAASDRTLSADEAAAILHKPRRWLFANAHRLPFITRISRKSLVASESGLHRWIKAQRS